MSEIARQVNIHNSAKRTGAPDVSLRLEHLRHYLMLADEQHDLLHDYVHDDVGVEISNRMGWLLDDLLTMLADIQNTLYPKG